MRVCLVCVRVCVDREGYRKSILIAQKGLASWTERQINTLKDPI